MGRDLTGSGKTLAFSLPMVEQLRKDADFGKRKLKAIILAPTRELALQVTGVINKLKHWENEFRVITVYGGVPIQEQIRDLKYGVDIFVGTTGRVLDHIERGNIDFSNLKMLMLDEADQMLKLGFREDIEKILSIIKIRNKDPIQKCLFSATFPDWVHEIARLHLRKDRVFVDLAKNLRNKTAQTVAHIAIDCSYVDRIGCLADVLACYGKLKGKTLVFTQTKADANSLKDTDKLKMGIEVMHGDIPQVQREKTLKRYKEGKF